MPQVQITPATLPISNPGAQPIYGQNNGTGVIYLSTTQDVSPTNYHALVGPGGSFTWPANEALYACTDAASTTLLTYLVNGATVDSGDVVSKSSNALDILYSNSAPFINAAQPTINLFNGLLNKDVSSYASLIFRIFNSGATVSDPTNYISAIINQYDISSRSKSSSAQWLNCDNTSTAGIYQTGVFELQIPVSAASGPNNVSAAIVAFFNVAPGAAGTLFLEIFGSHELIDGPRYTNSGGINDKRGKPSGTVAGTAQSVLVTVTNHIESTNDPGTLQLIKGTALAQANTAVLQMYSDGFAVPIASTNYATGDAAFIPKAQPVNPPMRALSLLTTPSGVAGQFYTNLQQ